MKRKQQSAQKERKMKEYDELRMEIERAAEALRAFIDEFVEAVRKAAEHMREL